MVLVSQQGTTALNSKTIDVCSLVYLHQFANGPENVSSLTGSAADRLAKEAEKKAAQHIFLSRLGYQNAIHWPF